MVQKTYSRMHSHVLILIMTMTDLVNHGMVKNKKTWISWERNIIFLRNKRILNLCFGWHIFRSYCFVAEVTFKVENLNRGWQKMVILWQSQWVIFWCIISEYLNKYFGKTQSLSQCLNKTLPCLGIISVILKARIEKSLHIYQG